MRRARIRLPHAVGPALCLALLAPAAAPAADAAELVVSADVDAMGAPQLEIRDGELQLSLDDAIAIALERNLGLVVERYTLEETGYEVKRNRGIFDTVVTGDLRATNETSPAATNLAGADVTEQESQSWDFGASQLTAWGGTLSGVFNNTRSETNSQFATLNPSFRVDLDATYSQPLLRDFGKATTKRGLRIAANNVQIGRENFELQVIGTVQQVEDAYWLLVEALEQYEVAEESLGLARELHEQNGIKVEVGTLAPLELVQSEAGIATREEELIRARSLIGDRADVLRQLLNLEDETLWQTPIAPQTPPEVEFVELDVAGDLRRALTDRPEVVSQRLANRNLEIDSAFFRNQLLPRLDVTVTYGFNGLGGDITERDFFTGEILFEAEGSYTDAVDQVTGTDFDGWAASVNVSYPLQNRTAEARKAQADVAVERGRAELRDLELQVTTAVRRLARAVDTARQVIESATVSQRLAERNLDAEQKRYENGMSTSFQVLEIQEDLSQARSRLVTARINYRRALVTYYEAVGRLLDEAEVEISGGPVAGDA